ncbi:MAG: hypothetical protein JL50_21815 [Peptococcaceae bacterium BICA1-7]|nr:MAG: hypothetical protein JL50_21815 [Peptococcaceae bacterium BICA1-7]HBV99376.1 hypothetical protein [Desulfotomaculum sp.]
MEWALAITDRGSLDLAGSPWKNIFLQGKCSPQQVVESLFGKIRFTRLYFGQEFCDRAIPGKEDMTEAILTSLKKGMKFSLVTPYTTEKALVRLEELLAELEDIRPFSEVICNDWGVIYLIRKKFSTLVPVMGRLLNKACREPRILKHLKDIPDGEAAAYRFSSSANPYTKSLLKMLGVARVEADNLPQGMEGGLFERGVPSSLYIPYGFVSTGRICFPGSWGLRQREKFMASGSSCSRLCRRYFLEMDDLSGCVGGDAVKSVFQKGNTVFYRQSEGLLTGGLKKARTLGIDRIVYQPVPN